MIYLSYNELLSGSAVEIELKGILDSSTAVNFEEYVNNFLNNGKKKVILNLKQLEQVSSGGIGNLLFLHRKISSLSGILLLYGIQSEIFSIFQLLGFDKIFNVTADAKEALQIAEEHVEMQEDITDNSESRPENIAASRSNEGQMERAETASNKVFENPIIMECAKCKGMIRVTKSGHFICPDCKGEFYVDQDQNITF